MVNQKLNSKLTLINAPAGSGKTTSIKEYIDYISNNYPNEFSLCLTFTNRAVDELKSKIYRKKVDIYTIHEYCNQILSSFYKSNEAKELFCEMFDADIINILNSEKQKDIDKLERYKSKYELELINKEIIKENIREIKYNQTNYTSYLNGTLSHDDLLNFIFYFSQRYSKFLDVISKKYKFIFIDEYQDTSSNILKMIYNACLKNNQYLILFGDKMQEIYSNYDGGFDDELMHFDTSKKLNTNYRSNKEIVEVLNNVYNNDDYKQTAFRAECGCKPKYLLTNNLMNSADILSNQYNNALQLYIANRERFEKIGVSKIFNAVGKIKDYQFGSRYEVTDILLDKSTDNPDTLIKFYFDLHEIYELINLNNFGAALNKIRENKYFNGENFKIKYPRDKQKINEKLIVYKEILSTDCSIIEILNKLNADNYINIETLNNILERDDYQEVLICRNLEFLNLYKYLSKKNISTQHGVKGESHDEVIMFIENSRSTNPNVKMYEFLNLLSSIEINFEDYKNFVMDFEKETSEVRDLFKDSSMWNSANVSRYQCLLEKTAKSLLLKFNDNIYFKNTGQVEHVEKYISKKTVKNAQDAFSLTNIRGILNAYRLFYVGCSRARKTLILVLLEEGLKDDKEKVITKLVQLGFEEYICKDEK